MKDRILNIIEEVFKRERFLESTTYNLTVNYNTFHKRYPENIFSGGTYDVVKSELEQIEEENPITSYNLTFECRHLCGNGYDFDTSYPDGWKSVQYIFWTGHSGLEDDSDMIDSTLGGFDFSYSGSGGSFRISDKLCGFEEGTHIRKDDDKYSHDKLNILLDCLLEYEELLDIQSLERTMSIDRIRTEKN